MIRQLDHPEMKCSVSRCMEIPTEVWEKRSTSTFSIYQDTFRDTFQTTPIRPQRYRHKHSHTLASSTHGGLDIYTRESKAFPYRNSFARVSCLEQVDEELAFDARLAFALEESLDAERNYFGHNGDDDDEGFFGGENNRRETIFNLASLCALIAVKSSNFQIKEIAIFHEHRNSVASSRR